MSVVRLGSEGHLRSTKPSPNLVWNQTISLNPTMKLRLSLLALAALSQGAESMAPYDGPTLVPVVDDAPTKAAPLFTAILPSPRYDFGFANIDSTIFVVGGFYDPSVPGGEGHVLHADVYSLDTSQGAF